MSSYICDPSAFANSYSNISAYRQYNDEDYDEQDQWYGDGDVDELDDRFNNFGFGCDDNEDDDEEDDGDYCDSDDNEESEEDEVPDSEDEEYDEDDEEYEEEDDEFDENDEDSESDDGEDVSGLRIRICGNPNNSADDDDFDINTVDVDEGADGGYWVPASVLGVRRWK